jgi:hypothetical protein
VSCLLHCIIYLTVDKRTAAAAATRNTVSCKLSTYFSSHCTALL